MDNLPAHKVKGVTSIIEDAGARAVYQYIINISIVVLVRPHLKPLDMR